MGVACSVGKAAMDPRLYLINGITSEFGGCNYIWGNNTVGMGHSHMSTMGRSNRSSRGELKKLSLETGEMTLEIGSRHQLVCKGLVSRRCAS
ncbi:hypothetical protein Nepgr_022397 [Nepenthes gracilis]|uniref:Uncharacterized protein n=1 Tax=Nepenthes gracilis TaxID=150966 RepID=A0AAD3T2H1_NEPGR|nr:hypothetical protein Nepgr_022397 [Nepenthes gracilis]